MVTIHTIAVPFIWCHYLVPSAALFGAVLRRFLCRETCGNYRVGWSSGTRLRCPLSCGNPDGVFDVLKCCWLSYPTQKVDNRYARKIGNM